MSNKIIFLEGDPGGTQATQQWDDLVEEGHECIVIDDLYDNPDKLNNLPEMDPDYIHIMTTGMRNEYREGLVEKFMSLKWIPKKIIFGSENSALTYCDEVRDLNEQYNIECYYYYGNGLFQKISWI